MNKTEVKMNRSSRKVDILDSVGMFPVSCSAIKAKRSRVAIIGIIK